MSVPVPCTRCGASTHSTQAGEVWHDSPSCRGLSCIFSYHDLGSVGRSSQASWPQPPGLRDNVLPGISSTAQHSNMSILAAYSSSNTHGPPALPPSASGRSQCRGHRFLHSHSSPSFQLRSALVIPPGDGGDRAVQHSSCAPSQETASINCRHIHPSADLGMAIPWLGLSPCSQSWVKGRGRQWGTRCGRKAGGEPGRSFCTEV